MAEPRAEFNIGMSLIARLIVYCLLVYSGMEERPCRMHECRRLLNNKSLCICNSFWSIISLSQGARKFNTILYGVLEISTKNLQSSVQK